MPQEVPVPLFHVRLLGYARALTPVIIPPDVRGHDTGFAQGGRCCIGKRLVALALDCQ